MHQVSRFRNAVGGWLTLRVFGLHDFKRALTAKYSRVYDSIAELPATRHGGFGSDSADLCCI